MKTPLIVRGRLKGPTSVELEEPVADAMTEVEVLVRPALTESVRNEESLAEFLLRLPQGSRSKDEIDAQIRTERADWGDR